MSFKRKGFIAGAALGAGVAAAALAGVGVRWPGAEAQQPALIKASAPVFAPPPGAPLSFADIFEKVAPAVVSIDVTSRPRGRQGLQIPGFEGFPFNFQGPNGQGGGGDDEEGGDDDSAPGPGGPGGPGGGGQPQRPEAQATGSGFFISGDGYIVTNNHVVEDAETITVRMSDQTELKATLVGRDEGTDLAVIKVEGTRKNYPFVQFERDAKPRVGDWVVAVGNPFNLGGTATAGIISAYGRDIGEQFVDYLQIDAPINRGNSGGPTFDVYGRVVGVNTAIFSPSGGSVGIGFAVPAELADAITKQLIANGKVSRGYLGVTIQNVNAEIGESLGIPARKGALVSDVVSDGPAAKAGIRTGDVIQSVNGKAVATASELTRQVALAQAGDNLKLSVFREGKTMEVNVRSGLRPSEQQLASNGDTPGGQTPTPKPDTPQRPTVLGLSLSPLDPATRERLNIGASVQGVAIENVASGSDAAKKTLRRGDVVVRVGDRAVAAPADVQTAVAAARTAKRPSVLLLINRGGRTIFVPLKLEE